MLNEMRAIRGSLQSFIMDEFLLDMQQMARLSQMKIESNSEVSVTPYDFKRTIKRLSNNSRNQGMVYDVFHKFHRDWITNAIDKWFQCEKVTLESENRTPKYNRKGEKFYATDCGGFSAVAQAVKSQIVKSYMLPMLQKAGWCIATTYKKTETTTMTYTKVAIPDCQDHYYVVTMLQKAPSCQPCKVSSNISTTRSLSTLNHENLDEDSVDISGVVSKINQEYGIHKTEEKLAGILSNHQLLLGAKLADSLQQNDSQAAVENQNTHNNTGFHSHFFSAFYPGQTVLDSNEARPPALVDVHKGEEMEQVNSPTPSATLELDDNASSVVEHHCCP